MLAYVIKIIPAQYARFYGVARLLTDNSPIACIVESFTDGACLGRSCASKVAAEHTRIFASGQSILGASARTDKARPAAAGTVRPRSLRDSM